MSIVESLLDTESEVFEFIWKPLPQGWGTFIKTIVIDCPSKWFLDILESDRRRWLSSLMLVDSERQIILSLIGDVDYGLDDFGGDIG